MNKNWLSFGAIFSAFLLMANMGGAETTYLAWKVIGWSIIMSFALGIIALPFYCLKAVMPAMLVAKLSAREQACAKALGLTLGIACLVFFLQTLR